MSKRALQGKDATLRVQVPGSGLGYLPFACATSAAFTADQELIEKTTLSSGRHKEFTTGLSEWGMTMTDVTYIVPESQMYTVWDMLLESVRRNAVNVELSFTDGDGNVKTITGAAVIPHIGITASAEGFVEDDIELKGTGAFTVQSALITTPVNNNEVKNYEYIATGGETTITFADFIGRTFLGIFRGFPHDIITAGTPTDVQAKVDSGAGTVTFSYAMNAGEYILILYK